MDQQQEPRWQPTGRQLLWAGAIVALLIVVILIGYRYGITLWNWLELLVVPAVIAGGGIWFNRQQRERELEIARQQREQELEIAERRTQDEALQAYLDQMSSMLIPNRDQPSLYKARPRDSFSSVARARTLTVLPRLNGARKARVVQFLYETGMIVQGRPVVDPRGANLSGAYLRWAFLSGAALFMADLREADLSGSYLEEADLRGTILYKADLSGATLSGADLSRADLREANLRGADLSGATLSGTYLSRADLSRSSLTDDQLREAIVLDGATMPDGQKYEDLRKDKEGRKEAGENE